MKLRAILSTLSALLILGGGACKGEQIWDSGSSLYEVIGYDLQAHDANLKLTDYQTNAVCLLLGYFRGFAEGAEIAAHYDATSLPFVLPDSINNDQIEHLVFQYLKDNPDRLILKGDAVMVGALTKAYPNPSFMPPLGSK